MEIKRKPGRPKKQTSETSINEDTKQINMSQDSQKSQQPQLTQNNNTNSMKNEDYITLAQVQNRWKKIFSKYSSLGMDVISSAWASSSYSLNNPFLQNQRIKKSVSNSVKMQKDELKEILTHPENSEDTLKSVSLGLYYTNYIYNTLIKLNRETPLYNYYATPMYLDNISSNKDNLRKESQFVDKALRSFSVKSTFKTIATQVSLEGKCSYLVRNSYEYPKNVDFFVLQKLDSNMVKLTGFGSKQRFIASFNMMIFLQSMYDVNQYPQFIRDTWADMIGKNIITVDKKGKKRLNPKAMLPEGHSIEISGEYYMYWVQLPQDLCYTFYSDGATPNSFPDTVGLFSDLNDLDDYKWLQASLLSKGVNSVLTAEVPLVKDPKAGGDSTAISPDTILGYTDFFAENISANIFPFFAPFN